MKRLISVQIFTCCIVMAQNLDTPSSSIDSQDMLISKEQEATPIIN